MGNSSLPRPPTSRATARFSPSGAQSACCASSAIGRVAPPVIGALARAPLQTLWCVLRQSSAIAISPDFEIDRKDHDAGNKITIPMLALWGDAGIASSAATPLDTWSNWATNVSGAPVDSGHFLTEENPDATAKALRAFFLAG